MIKVLITDDSATARMVIHRCLEVIGFDEFEFHEAGNGQEALEKLRASPFDLLITDINMPVMDGKKLLLNVKASPKLNSVVVIVVSSLGNPALGEELMKIGANRVIHKPISPEKLQDALSELFRKDQTP